jgi:hypothetical protein
VHHASNPLYLDRNYAGVLMVWDRLFGTFVAERDDVSPRYGIVKNIDTFNPIRIAFHEWTGIIHDLAAVRSVREGIGIVFGPPGWRADGNGPTSKRIRGAAHAATGHYDGVASAPSTTAMAEISTNRSDVIS